MSWKFPLAALWIVPLLAPEPIVAAEPLVPAQEDWRDFGWVIEAGAEGDWDHYLEGMLTASISKKDGSYFLYYGGACCYSKPLDSVTFRAIGVATSLDGVRFSKHQQNPIISWLPNNGREEGATSSAATVDSTGQSVLYFGANTRETRTTVNADARLGVSADGLNFEDMGVVLDHRDRSVWGSGDEIFPIIALQHQERWIVFYLTNGVPHQRHLGVAWGTRRDRLTNSSAAMSDGHLIPVWGVGGGAALVAPDTYAVFLNDLRIPATEVRTFSVESPEDLSAPIQTYQWPDVKQATVLLDREARTWFLYYRDFDQRHYGVKLASFGTPDETPPSTPGSLHATVVAPSSLDLTWHRAIDLDTGIAQYRVYRDGEIAESTSRESFHDSGLQPGRVYSYAISAVNFHGIESTRSPSIDAGIPES